MTLITPEYVNQQKDLHAKGNYGISSGKWSPTVAQLAHMYGCKDILDYGSGTGQLKQALGAIVREYDPCIDGKDGNPAPADMVVCTDVLEHIEPDLLDEVLAHLKSKFRKVLFFTIALRPAKKVLADGRNAHLIVETSSWWRERLTAAGIRDTLWEPVEGAEVVGMSLAEGITKVPTGVRPSRRKIPAKKRREFEAFFNFLREGSRRYSDPLSVVDTFEFWEGSPDDQVADVQVVIDSLEHQWDVHAALIDIKSKARNSVMFRIDSDFRGMDYWKQTIGMHFQIGDVFERDGRIAILAGVKTMLPAGANIVAAGTSEERWANMVAACAAHPDIVPTLPPHGRRAIIGCYGPSLNDTWEALANEAQSPDADVVSVSGSHDWLLAKGIVPRFHVECDPRRHKADNIARPHPEVEYLLSASCHPVLFDKLAGARIKLWHSCDNAEARRVVDELKSPAPIIFGGGSVGMRAITVMYRMGYRNLSIHGMDCSFSDDGSAKWAGAHAQKDNAKDFKLMTVRYQGRLFTTTGILLAYGTDFFDMMNRIVSRDPTLQFTMHGDGLLQARLAGGEAPIEIIIPEQEAA